MVLGMSETFSGNAVPYSTNRALVPTAAVKHRLKGKSYRIAIVTRRGRGRIVHPAYLRNGVDRIDYREHSKLPSNLPSAFAA